MKVSVVIATTNRARSLRVTLDALRHQTYRDFEVIVVQGPCDDGTDDLLAEREGQLRVVHNPERNLCKSRNLGIDLAAGEVVAFIDDDGVPEPRWLEELVVPFAESAVGGAGGLVYDQTGVQLQYRYAVCDRVGHTDFDRRPPLDAFNRPGADARLEPLAGGLDPPLEDLLLAHLGALAAARDDPGTWELSPKKV